MTDFRNSQVGVELWMNNLSRATFSQAGQEVWISRLSVDTKANFSQVGQEVWIGRLSVDTKANFSQIGLEVWRTVNVASTEPEGITVAYTYRNDFKIGRRLVIGHVP